MKMVVIGEDEVGVVIYNVVLVVFLNYYGVVLWVCQLYWVKIKGKVEWFFCYIWQDFFLVCIFCNIDDLNFQFEVWWIEVVNFWVYVMIWWVVDVVFVEEQFSLKLFLVIFYSVVLMVECWVSKEGMILVGGYFYFVFDIICCWIFEVQYYVEELWIFEDG